VRACGGKTHRSSAAIWNELKVACLAPWVTRGARRADSDAEWVVEHGSDFRTARSQPASLAPAEQYSPRRGTCHVLEYEVVARSDDLLPGRRSQRNPGQDGSVVKASLVGSILGNILLVMGMAMLAGWPAPRSSALRTPCHVCAVADAAPRDRRLGDARNLPASLRRRPARPDRSGCGVSIRPTDPCRWGFR
jgi:hypothetical protein